ncbi:hypothetical protein [Deinococcus marmoris]|uniref:hypothetical protein n=1 Tax=Deinococcus marmoris TaxID=249408 RepID=UPI000497FA52|nr:hypothetical protein [Deinococcus marmoris]
MKFSDVLLCLSFYEQRQAEIYNRLTERGHIPRLSYVRQTLKRLTTDGLVVTRKTEGGEFFYRLAEGEAVEAVLNDA